MNPRFSIVTPCFNGMPALRRCIGSVRGQTGATFEHLVQDAVSDDGSAEWALAQPDLLARSEKDAGMYDAINKGWARSRGEILAWLNADEQYLPGTLAHVARAFDEHPDTDVITGNTIFVGPEGQALAARREIPLRENYVANGVLYIASCSIFFHRRLWDEGLLPFDTTFRLAGDFDLILRLLAKKRRFVHLPEYLSLFGVDGTNMSVKQAQRMEEEATVPRARHGACASQAMRRVVLLGRHIERLLAGCYAAVPLAYDFADSEKPAYRHIEARNVSGRFTYESAIRKLGGTNP